MAEQNPSLTEDAEAQYRQESQRLRFMNQLLGGVGGAIVFGLVASMGSSLLGVVATASIPAILGLAALAVTGIGCVYLGSRFLTKNIILDQDYQARKIGEAARDKTPVTELALPPRPAIAPGLPGSGIGARESDVAALDVSETLDQAPRVWTQSIAPTRPDRAKLAARGPLEDRNWANRAAEDAPAVQRSA